MKFLKAAFAAFFVLSLFGLTFSALGAESKNCTPEQKTKADKLLWLNAKDKQKSIERHLPSGAPQAGVASSSEMLLVHSDYVINYSSTLLVPIWTAHRLDAKGLGKIDRINCFRRDPRINALTASLLSDYKEPIFDQGHLSPNADMSRGLYPVINSFVLSNMTPQYCQFNQGVWQIFESLVRRWVTERKTLYVISGSIFDRDGDGRRDPDADAKRMKSNNGQTRVAVPSHFYKIILHRRSDGTLESLSVMLPQDQVERVGNEAIQHLEKHIRSIRDIETVAGLNFSLTATEATALWSFAGKPPPARFSPACKKTAGHHF